ncbi:MAG: hypothetical protein ACXVCP_05390 [Bdellovibrio sp.]
MKWLMLMLTIMFRKFSRPPSLKESAMEIFEEVSHRSRKIISLTLTGIAAVIIFCGGFFISLINATTQYDNTGKLFLTATLSAGLVLIAFALITFAVIFLRAWPGVKERNAKEQLAAGSSLEQALSLLVLDFVKARQEKREATASHAGYKPEEPSGREKPMEHEPPPSNPLH